MKTPFDMVVAKLLVLLLSVSALRSVYGTRKEPIYSNHFAVHIPDGQASADSVAGKHGFVNKGQVSSLMRLLSKPDTCYGILSN